MAVSLRELWWARDPREADDAHRGAWRALPTDTNGRGAIPDNAITTDVEWITHIRAGDEAAFDALFRAEFPRLVGFVTALLGEADVAQDVAADVFARIWRRRAEWDPQGSIRGYLFRAARNQAANVRRGDRRRDTLRERAGEGDVVPQPSVPSDVALERADLIAQLWQTIDALPPQRRAIAYLRWREGMEYEEIGTITGQSVAAVKMQVSRTLSALRALLPDLAE